MLPPQKIDLTIGKYMRGIGVSGLEVHLSEVFEMNCFTAGLRQGCPESCSVELLGVEKETWPMLTYATWRRVDVLFGEVYRVEATVDGYRITFHGFLDRREYIPLSRLRLDWLITEVL